MANVENDPARFVVSHRRLFRCPDSSRALVISSTKKGTPSVLAMIC